MDGKKNVVPEVWEVLDKIKGFTDKVSLSSSILASHSAIAITSATGTLHCCCKQLISRHCSKSIASVTNRPREFISVYCAESHLSLATRQLLVSVYILDIPLVHSYFGGCPVQVRSGEWLGATGKPLTDVVAVGIGGSFLGPLFVHTALRQVFSSTPVHHDHLLADSLQTKSAGLASSCGIPSQQSISAFCHILRRHTAGG